MQQAAAQPSWDFTFEVASGSRFQETLTHRYTARTMAWHSVRFYTLNDVIVTVRMFSLFRDLNGSYNLKQ